MLTDSLPGGCCVEALGTPKYSPPSRYHFHPPSAYLGVDARWGFDGVHQKKPRCGPT